VGSDATLSSEGGSLRFYDATFPISRVQISCLTRASWSFKASLNGIQTNAEPFVAPCLPT
jgi:hypothetical protein